MQDSFKRLSGFYKSYFKLKSKLDEEFKNAQNSGNFSRSYLNKMSAEHLEKLKNERSIITNKMCKEKEAFMQDLTAKYNLERNMVSSNLVNLLNCGIKFNERELLEIAEKHKSNLTESRLLHDFAEKEGYKLNNYIPFEEVVLNYDNYCKNITSSLAANDKFTMPYLTQEDCEIAGGKYCKKSMVPTMEIEPIAKTVEEAIIRDFKKQNGIAKLQEEAFLIGLNGTEEEKANFKEKLKHTEKTEKEILEDKIKLLTTEEKADAEYLSIYKGHKGKITQEEIDFINSKEYTEIVEEREAKNE